MPAILCYWSEAATARSRVHVHLATGSINRANCECLQPLSMTSTQPSVKFTVLDQSSPDVAFSPWPTHDLDRLTHHAEIHKTNNQLAKLTFQLVLAMSKPVI